MGLFGALATEIGMGSGWYRLSVSGEAHASFRTKDSL